MKNMKTPWFVGFAALVAVASGESHVSAQEAGTLKVRIIDVSIQDKQVRVTLAVAGAGQPNGVMPGDKGFFLKDGAKIGGDGNFEIFKVTDRAAFAMTAMTRDMVSQRTSMEAKIATSRTCAANGARPNFAQSPAVALGKTPPPGFVFATVMSTAADGANAFAFTIDKGSDDLVMPSSSAYALLAGTGSPLPYKVDITWVTKTTAGGYVRNVPNGEEAQKTARKLGVEQGSCKSSK